MRSAGAALRFDHVMKRYANGVVALADVSIEISAGARVAILGPNGAGKTTLVRIALGLVRPTLGEVFLGGDVLSTENRRALGYLPQAPGMYPDLSVREYLELAGQLYRRSTFADVVDVLGLAPYLGHVLAELSGGLQRRLAFAAAIVGQPSVIVLDEPTAGMDPMASREVRSYVRDQLSAATVLLCTHDLKDAEGWTDELAILRHGQLMVHAPLSELRRETPVTVRIRTHESPAQVAQLLRPRGMPVAIDGGALVVEVAGDPKVQASAMLGILESAGAHVYECRIEEPTIEDIYVRELARA